MSYSQGLSRRVAIGVPLLLLAAGGAAGWFLGSSDDGASTTPGAPVVGRPFPEPLDTDVPLQPLPALPNPAVIDPASIVGLDRTGELEVPGGAGIQLPLAGGTAIAVDPTTYEPVDGTEPAAPSPAAPSQAAGTAPTLGTTPSTLAPPDPEPSRATVPIGRTPEFIDPCMASDPPCSGAPAVVLDTPVADEQPQLAALVVSLPMAAADGLAPVCDAVEGDDVPDGFLVPAVRPTVAVLVNQPSTLALTGTWGDGSPIAKTTMVTLAAHDAEWQAAWETGQQRNIVACVTLPLDDVRSHAAGGVATLRADILAISATGRAEITGQVTLHIPTDGDDPLLADRLTITDRGEQRLSDGVLHPAVHVHYAVLTDAVLPSGSRLDPDSLRVVSEHAFVEGADCSGWAVNQQGRDRTVSGTYRITTEQRSVAGRDRPVAVVDGEVFLDADLPGGWQGHFCVRLTATDETAARAFTLTLQGATMRSPRTPVYAVGVLLDDSELPADQQLQVSWNTREGTGLCTEATIANDAGGAATDGRGARCTVYARTVPDGIVVDLRASGGPGVPPQPLLRMRVPVNTAYCNPDDPFAALSNGCSPGYQLAYTLPLAVADDVQPSSVRVVLTVERTAAAGQLWQDPSQAWKISAVTNFAS